jgi:hypothetical protein
MTEGLDKTCQNAKMKFQVANQGLQQISEIERHDAFGDPAKEVVDQYRDLMDGYRRRSNRWD